MSAIFSELSAAQGLPRHRPDPAITTSVVGAWISSNPPATPRVEYCMKPSRWRALPLALLFGGTVGYGQVSATATIHVRIVEPLGITRLRDLDFGEVVRGSAGRVEVDPEGRRTSQGSVSLGSSTVASALFQVRSGGGSFQVQLPDRVRLTSGTQATLEARDFKAVLKPLAEGQGRLHQVQIGASLQLDGSQVVGDYFGSFKVTVAYD